jgi:hypothetical protein
MQHHAEPQDVEEVGAEKTDAVTGA